MNLDHVEVLVLDEADHMFDMGFLPDVRRILRALPQRRQNLLFSATMPREIRKLADTVLCNPAVVELGNSRPAETIEHSLCSLDEPQKIGALEHLFGGEDFHSAIVFLRTKQRAKRLARRLDSRGHAAIALQGNMSQGQRERALAGFKEGRYDVLVATDVAARGLDIVGVSHVINFDVPNVPDAYTHRIGRTGRSEQKGTAFTFVTPDDAAAIRAIEKRLGAAITRQKVGEFGTLERISLRDPKGSSPMRGPGRRQGGANGRTHGGRKGPQTGKRSHPASRSPRAAADAVLAKVLGGSAGRPATTATTAHRPAFGVGVLDAPAASSKRTRTEETVPKRPRRRRRRS